MVWLCGPVAAQVYKCAVTQHWRNSAADGQYVGESPTVVEGAGVVLDFNQGKITAGSMGPVNGQRIVAGPSSIALMGGGTRELTTYTVFPRVADPNGGVLGSVMRVDDNEYMPKGTLMSRLSCKAQ